MKAASIPELRKTDATPQVPSTFLTGVPRLDQLNWLQVRKKEEKKEEKKRPVAAPDHIPHNSDTVDQDLENVNHNPCNGRRATRREIKSDAKGKHCESHLGTVGSTVLIFG